MQVLYDLEQGTGSMPMRWFLEESDQDKIRNSGATELFVVLDVFYGERRHSVHQRWVLPVSDMMHFLPFRRPGEALVCIALVCPVEQIEARQMLNYLNRRFDKADDYVNHVFEFRHERGMEISAFVEDVCEVIDFQIVRVDVPQEFFAKPWPKWLKWWAELFPREVLRRKLIDDCDRWRWMIFSFTLQPPILILYGIVVLVFFGAFFLFSSIPTFWYSVMLGYRGADWRSIWYLECTSIMDIRQMFMSKRWSSRYITDEAGKLLPWWRVLLQPALAVMGVGLFLLLSGYASGVFALAVVPATLLLGWVPFVYVLTLAVLARGLTKPRVKAQTKTNRVQWDKETVRKQELEGLVADLSYPADGVVLNIEALPEKRRSLRLKYRSLKARICQPLPQ